MAEPTPVLARDVLVTMFRENCRDPGDPNKLGLAPIWETPHFAAAFLEIIGIEYLKDRDYYDGIMTPEELKQMDDMYNYFWKRYDDYAKIEYDCVASPGGVASHTVDAFKKNIALWYERGTRIPPTAYLSGFLNPDKYILKDGKHRAAFLCAKFMAQTGTKPDNFRILLSIEPGQLVASNGTSWTDLNVNANRMLKITKISQRMVDSRQYEPPDSGLDKKFPEPFYAVFGHGCLNGLACPWSGRATAVKKTVPRGVTIVFVTLPGGVAYQEAHLTNEFIDGLRARRMSKTYRGSYFVVYQEGDVYCDSDIHFYDDPGDPGRLDKHGIYRYGDPGQPHALTPMYVPGPTNRIQTTVGDIISQMSGTYIFETCRVASNSDIAKNARNANRAALRPGSPQERRLDEIEASPNGPRQTAMLRSVDSFKRRGIISPLPLDPQRVLRPYSSMRVP